ncbi:MAG TPA: dihydrolipoamide acetyltransferase family protein [Thermoanaerobaculia bacterium]|jgi:pyruvate dehydrogenase E2 component (dihydrolipoamide acetyltransferase)|nr:dihydrolipoamide acetyltransferase family protein [Thermoanaerobaculia bacterium]
MAVRIVMPTFGMYTAEGVLARWLVEPGARVEAGELVAEITTEKASYDLESPASGLLHHVAKVGDPLAIEGLIGFVLDEGEAPPVNEPGGVSVEATWRVPAQAENEPVPVRGLPAPAATPTESYARARASPAARRLAAQRGVDLANVVGSGPGGRIVEADVLAAAERMQTFGADTRASGESDRALGAIVAAGGGAAAAGAGAAAATGPATIPWRIQRRIALTGIRGAVARRLRECLATTVPLTLTREVRADALAATRARLRESLGASPWDALFVKLFADALREQPALNAVVAGGEVLVLDDVHVGFAVPMSEGLIVPVVHDADRRPLAEVVAAVRDLGERARAGNAAPADVLGGTATISNLGAHGVDAFTPVLNPPQSAILGVGRIADRAVVEEGRLVVAPTCVLSLTFDHRVADGVPAAQLLAAVAARLNDAGYLDAL